MDLPFFTQYEGLPRKNRPAEYVRGYGWIQEGQRGRLRKKPHYCFIWPKDGRNGGKLGRMKDIATGKGPDIHVTVSAEKGDYMANRQRKASWARHINLDDRYDDRDSRLKNPWTKHPQRSGTRYDFLQRKYRRPDENMMTDAIWHPGVSSKQFPYPACWRDIRGEWFQHDPHAFDYWAPPYHPLAF